VDEHDPAAVRELSDDLVAEHGARRCEPELLDVRPAETARADPDELAAAVRFRYVGEPRKAGIVQGDRPHGGYTTRRAGL
jgi:hypothetical protein